MRSSNELNLIPRDPMLTPITAMLENRLPAQGSASFPKLNTLPTPLTDEHDDECSVSSPSNHSESYPSPLIVDNTTVSESDTSLLNTMTSATSISSIPSVGLYSKDIIGTEPISEFLQAELYVVHTHSSFQ